MPPQPDVETGEVRHTGLRYYNVSVRTWPTTRKPETPKKLDPVKEWERVKEAWNDDQAAWERYSGLKLPTFGQ